MLIEELKQWFEELVSEAADTLGDGTYYYPDENGWQLDGIKDAFFMYVTLVNGAAGNWTVTVEAKFRGDTVWRDKTNAWFSVANFTASRELDRSTATTCLDAVRLKAIRANDAANTDGEIDIKGAFQRRRV